MLNSARRRLPVLGVVVVLLVVAGCAGFSNNSATPTTNSNSTSETTTEPMKNTPETTAGVALTGTPTTVETETTLAAVTGPTKLRQKEYPWEVSIGNTDTDPLAVTLQLDRDGERLANRTYTLAPGTGIDTVLWAKGNYTVTVGQNGTTETTKIDREDFDCNQKWLNVQVNDTNITTTTIQTDVECVTDDLY